MEQEDELSLKAEIFFHKQRFSQKDELPPKLPKVFTDLGLEGQEAGPLAYMEMQSTPRP